MDEPKFKIYANEQDVIVHDNLTLEGLEKLIKRSLDKEAIWIDALDDGVYYLAEGSNILFPILLHDGEIYDIVAKNFDDVCETLRVCTMKGGDE